MLKFKFWLENEEMEYEPPDEGEMQKIANIPLKIDLLPNLNGDLYRCKMPIGSVKDFLIKRGSIIGINKPVGSLNSACFRLLNNNKVKDLYELLRYVQFNNNSKIRSQLLSYKEN